MSFRWRKETLFFVAAAILALPPLLAVALFFSPEREPEIFFAAYWERPIPLQGPPPASFTEREASLRPEACGSCHERQYADWKSSLHSRATGPGPRGQLIDMIQKSPEEANLCMTCHGPLGEQMAFIARTGAGGERIYEKNPQLDPQLQLEGITCAACHVRGHRRFGPPRAGGGGTPDYPPGPGNHGGVQRTAHFEKAEFCKGCHQFDPGSSTLVNGKPLQDTYREWRRSEWGKAGAACQDCHMPNRRHLWRGIHDPEWVKDAVLIEARLRPSSSPARNAVELEVEVTNAAVGHNFPTYITPKVFLRAELLDEAEKTLPGTLQEAVIGWDARFEGGSWKEYFDTRVPPGGKHKQAFRWTSPGQAKKIRARVEVHPDHFYHVHFYPSYLQGRDLSPEGRRLIEKARRESGLTAYPLFDRVIPLGGSVPQS